MRAPTPLAAALLILTALPACDNVRWGGQSVHIIEPPPAGPGEVEPAPEGSPSLGLPAGSVLFHVVRTGRGARVIPVAEVSGDSLRTLRRPAGVAPEAFEQRFRETVLGQSFQLALFRRGAPVGTATLQGAGPVTACGIPTAEAVLTTVAAAADQAEFLAFRRGLEPRVVGEYSPPQVEATIRRYGGIVAERLVLANGMPRPRSWAGAQRDLQALDAIPGAHPEMSATYLSGDQLAVGAPEENGYSVFYLAAYDTRAGYTPFYQEVRDYRKTDKAAPRVVDHLNWNNREGQEVLVQVFGTRQEWYQALAQDDGGRWRKVWEAGRCEPEES